MAFNLPNFVGQTYQPDYSGIGDAVSNYFQGKMMPSQALIEKVKAQFAQPDAQADLDSARLKNVYQSIVNQFAPQSEQAKINLDSQMAKMYGMGGGGRGNMTNQLLMSLQNQLKVDNPNLTNDQINDAYNNILGGQFTLSDGTPFNAANSAKVIAGKLVTSSQPAALTTQNVKAGQAEAELPALEQYANSGLAPYANTFAGFSPDQIKDTFKSDDASQRRLGKFIASQGLQYEIAQNRIRLANGQPGIGSTDELMKLSQQSIDAKYPKLSAVARQAASDTMDEALSAGLAARKKVGVLGSGALQGSSGDSASSSPSSEVTATLNGKKYVKRGGKWYPQ